MTIGKCSFHSPSEILTIFTFEHYRNPQMVISENSGLRKSSASSFTYSTTLQKKFRKHHRKGKGIFYNPGYQTWNCNHEISTLWWPQQVFNKEILSTILTPMGKPHRVPVSEELQAIHECREKGNQFCKEWAP